MILWYSVAQAYQPSRLSSLATLASVHAYREFQNPALTRLDHPLFAPPCVEHVHTTFLPAQDDVSHPDSERELVLRVGFGIET